MGVMSSQIYPNFKDLNKGLPSLLKLTSTLKIWTGGGQSFSNLPQLQRSEQGADKPFKTYLNFKDLDTVIRGLTILLKLTSTSKIWTGGWQSFSNLPQLQRSGQGADNHCSAYSLDLYRFPRHYGQPKENSTKKMNSGCRKYIPRQKYILFDFETA